jgi:recombination protein RecT
MKAAQDGLLPDGREGAMVIFKTKDGPKAQWMPMIAGLRKKVRNSGEIATWDSHVVRERDVFEYRLGDDPLIRHEPSLEDDPGAVIAAYSIATLKSGEKSREIMSVAEIERVRARSRSEFGPWHTDFDEMCRKTVARRHSKSLPMSTDLDDLIRRDDELYDLKGAGDESVKPRASLGERLSALAGSVPGTIDETANSGGVHEPAPPLQAAETTAPAADQEAGDASSARLASTSAANA